MIKRDPLSKELTVKTLTQMKAKPELSLLEARAINRAIELIVKVDEASERAKDSKLIFRG